MGAMVYKGKTLCFSLEKKWLDNRRRVSCIPEGTYKVTRRTSQKFGRHFILHDVPNRDYILIHKGNFDSDTLGCILVGMTIEDLNHDQLPDVSSSLAAMNMLLDMLPLEFELTIQSKHF